MEIDHLKIDQLTKNPSKQVNLLPWFDISQVSELWLCWSHLEIRIERILDIRRLRTKHDYRWFRQLLRNHLVSLSVPVQLELSCTGSVCSSTAESGVVAAAAVVVGAWPSFRLTASGCFQPCWWWCPPGWWSSACLWTCGKWSKLMEMTGIQQIR